MPSLNADSGRIGRGTAARSARQPALTMRNGIPSRVEACLHSSWIGFLLWDAVTQSRWADVVSTNQPAVA